MQEDLPRFFQDFLFFFRQGELRLIGGAGAYHGARANDGDAEGALRKFHGDRLAHIASHRMADKMGLLNAVGVAKTPERPRPARGGRRACAFSSRLWRIPQYPDGHTE